MTDFYLSPTGNDLNPGNKNLPWKSIARALEELKSKNYSGDVTIHLAPGVHRLQETVVIRPEHVGTGSVTFRGSEDEATTLSSGYLIDDWKLLEEDLPDLPEALRGRVWYTDLPLGTRVNTLYGADGSLPRARGKAIQPQLLEFEKAADMPDTYGPNGRNPKDIWLQNPKNRYIHQGFAFLEGAIEPASDLHEAEFLIIPRNQWTMNILPLKAVDFEKRFAEVGESCSYPIGIPGCAKDGSIWLENSLSVMTEGTWVYHAKKGRLYLCPMGDEPEDGIEAASLTEFIRIEGVHDIGVKRQLVENVHFENLTFTHSNRFSFHGLTGKGIQHDWEMHDAGSSMVRFRHAQGCSVANCIFEHGGSGGVRLDLECRENRIEGNTFRHLGACGVLLCGYGPSRYDFNRDNVVTDNHIHHIGEAYWHCPGIFIWQSGHNHIARNHLHDLPYTAIVCSGRILYDREGVQECSGTINWEHLEEQCGEGYVYNIWWYSGITDWQKREPLLHSRENLIEYNRIHDVMQTMGDGNGIYISGGGGGNVVRFNTVGPCPSPTMAEGIRCDDDQHHTIVHGNLIFAQGGYATGITLKGINRVTNNVLALPLTTPKRGMLSLETGPLNGSVIQRNIILTSAADQESVSEIRIHGSGRKARLMDADSDANLYYCSADPKVSQRRLEELQSYGTDGGSQSVDPGFVDAEGGDFNLKPDSAALKMGIQPLPLSKMWVDLR